MSEIEIKIRELLIGIDKYEIEDKNGWWETSYAVEFGSKILKQLIELINEESSKYGREQWNTALDAVLKMDCDTMEDETGRVYIPVDEIYELKK